jgi:phage tail sheath protein FI
MPVTPTYPGVYIEEIPSGVRTIVGVATSITAFIGRALQGPTDKAVRIQSFADYERQFGGLWVESLMSYAVQQFFLTGGTDAIIVRVVSGTAQRAEADASGLTFIAANPGEWSSKENQELVVEIEEINPSSLPSTSDATLFNLKIQQKVPNQLPRTLEVFRNLSAQPNASRFVTNVLAEESNFVRIREAVLPIKPGKGSGTFQGGSNGNAPPTYAEYWQQARPVLDKVDLFNLMCIPPNVRDGSSVADDDAGKGLLSQALEYCEERRAMLIVDPPTKWTNPSAVADDSDKSIKTLLRSKNAAVYFPNVRLSDQLKENRLETFPPSAVIAGIMARTDAQRGVWKAPAGIEATLSGVQELTYKMTDRENGLLNPLGVNCLRSFPVYGNVVWGARSMEGADQLASEWKYVPVRRLALFLEESLYRGTQWVVFEPNDEPLWSQIRLNIGAFMNNLFRQGAFQGKTPREAYLVKCDKETTTQNDINLGIVNIVVGFAPLKPAEFVIIKIQQLAGQIEV